MSTQHSGVNNNYFSLKLYNYFWENKKLMIVLNCLLAFTFSHEILLCLFNGFSIRSIIIFLILIFLQPIIRIRSDDELISLLSGVYLGIKGAGLTIDKGWSQPFSGEISDQLLRNWIMFLSSPILGIILFFVFRYIIELVVTASQNKN
ncbi:MAG: hypothetical protein CMB56_006285 [Methanobacteriota archaeon]|nr:MAG: hypothetical protein CMB56_006285 [Euryarchaeota archaeon]